MSGAWYALATLAVALVIRWYIAAERGSAADESKKPKKFANRPEKSKN